MASSPAVKPLPLMQLPVELIDGIIGHLPSGDEESLRNCSLVAKPWADLCQRRIFQLVRISPSTYQSWIDSIPPTNTGLLRHVRNLTYLIRGKQGSWHPPCRIGDELKDYLPSFSQLSRLTLGFMDIEPIIPDHPNLFSAFQHTLSSLYLVRVSVTWNGFVTLLSYFPNIRNLEVRDVSFEMDSCPSLDLRHPLRGRLFVRCAREKDPRPFIDQFITLKPEYEELVIAGDYDEHLVAVVQDNLKYLRITRCNCAFFYRTDCHTAYTDPLRSQRTSLWISRIVQNFVIWESPCWIHKSSIGPLSHPSPP